MLRDPADPNVSPIVLSEGAADVLALLDGQRTLPQVTSALLLRGGSITESQLRSFLTQLDEAGFLEGPRAEYRFEQRRAKFLAQPVRPAIHAGGAYPDGPEDLSRMLAAAYLHSDGPKSAPARLAGDATPLRAAIAPHVDLHRGAPTYSWAYKALAEAQPAELYVVLGTCHTGVQGYFAATSKRTTHHLDRCRRTQSSWTVSAATGVAISSPASSRTLGSTRSNSRPSTCARLAWPAKAPRRWCQSCAIRPQHGARGQVAARRADRQPFPRHVQQTLAEDRYWRITIVTAVDLAHIGQRFGDAWLVDLPRQAMVGTADREMLDFVLAPDADAYYAQVMRDRDARRICGFTPIYVLTALMQAEQRRGELLRYTQWVDSDKSSSVTFASAIFR